MQEEKTYVIARLIGRKTINIIATDTDSAMAETLLIRPYGKKKHFLEQRVNVAREELLKKGIEVTNEQILKALAKYRK